MNEMVEGSGQTQGLMPAKRRRVGLVVGDCVTLHCGVKDHAYRLKEALEPIGFDVDVIAPNSWSIFGLPAFLHDLRAGRYDVLHIQYPSIGFRSSLVPHLMGLLGVSARTVATLHEYTLLPLPQRLSVHAFRWTAHGIFFGSSFERSRYNGWLGKRGSVQEVFPILSQVPSAPAAQERSRTIVYFGQIRPSKGLEAFLELARLSDQRNRPFSFLILGSISRSNERYAEALQANADAGVRWLFDLSFQQVAEHMAESFAAYLPFPDGASERRGSMPAAWLNGLPVLSTVGEATTDSIRERIVVASSPDQALIVLDRLLAEPDEWNRLSQTSYAYTASHSWKAVAQRHAQMYTTVLSARKAG